MNIIFILIGGACAVYAEAGEEQNIYILILGIVILMIGLYRLSRQIPDKEKIEDNHDTTSK